MRPIDDAGSPLLGPALRPAPPQACFPAGATLSAARTSPSSRGQDIALSRRKRGFDSRWGRHLWPFPSPFPIPPVEAVGGARSDPGALASAAAFDRAAGNHVLELERELPGLVIMRIWFVGATPSW